MDIKGVKWTSPKDSASFSGEGGLVLVVHEMVGSCQVEVVQGCGHFSLEANLASRVVFGARFTRG